MAKTLWSFGRSESNRVKQILDLFRAEVLKLKSSIMLQLKSTCINKNNNNNNNHSYRYAQISRDASIFLSFYH